MAEVTVEATTVVTTVVMVEETGNYLPEGKLFFSNACSLPRFLDNVFLQTRTPNIFHHRRSLTSLLMSLLSCKSRQYLTGLQSPLPCLIFCLFSGITANAFML